MRRAARRFGAEWCGGCGRPSGAARHRSGACGRRNGGARRRGRRRGRPANGDGRNGGGRSAHSGGGTAGGERRAAGSAGRPATAGRGGRRWATAAAGASGGGQASGGKPARCQWVRPRCPATARRPRTADNSPSGHTGAPRASEQRAKGGKRRGSTTSGGGAGKADDGGATTRLRRPPGLSAQADVGDSGLRRSAPEPCRRCRALPTLRSGAPDAEAAGGEDVRPAGPGTPKAPRSAVPGGDPDGEPRLSAADGPGTRGRRRTKTARTATAQQGKGKGKWPRLRGRRTAVIR